MALARVRTPLLLAVGPLLISGNVGSPDGGTAHDSVRIPGGMVFGTAWRGEATANLAWTAFQAGFRAFDTANQPHHYNQSALGEVVQWAAAAGVSRKELWMQTKFTHPNGHAALLKQPEHEEDSTRMPRKPLTSPYNFSATTEKQVKESFARSLQQLRTSYVDALFLHAPAGRGNQLATSDWQAWRSMEELALSGQVRALGVSNINAAQLRLLLSDGNVSAGAEEVIRVRPTLVQNRCWASRGNWDAEVRAVCAQYGLIYQGFSLVSRGVNGHVVSGANGDKLQQIAADARAAASHASRDISLMQLTPEQVKLL